VLRDASTRTTAGASRLRVRNLLVLAEVALAVVLLVGCALLLRSFAELRAVHPGFEPDGIVTFGLFLPSAGYPDAASQLAFYDGLLTRLEAFPGVTGVAGMTGLPPRRDMDANDTDFEGIEWTPGGPSHSIDYYQTATLDYLDVMRIRVVEGRGFEHTDVNGPAVAVINERTARTFYSDGSPIGRRLRPCCGDDNPWFTIVGVTQDVKQGGIEEPAGTEMYVLYPQREHTSWGLPRSMNVVVRTQGDPRAIMGAARAAVAELDPTLPLANPRSMNDVLYASMAGPRFMTLLLSIFAGVALALAAIGTYGVMAYSVAQRRREFGIRMALGAEQGAVLGMVLRQGFSVAVLGLAIGLAAALVLTRLLSALLFNVTTTDVTAFVAAPLVLGAVALFACWVPALRATRVDPARVLKQE
jgi:putative ABC transport system permease protein